MDFFNKKKVLKLQQEKKSLEGTVLRMSKQLSYLQSLSQKQKEEIEDLKFTLKHRRTY